jgi:DNA-binding LacI/PurR family transcriptional regulator
LLKYQKIKADLVSFIHRSQAGESLPPRIKMMEMFHATRTTIDKAVNELIKEGLLYSVRGSGTYIAKKISPSKVTAWAMILPDILHDTYPGILRGVEDIASRNAINVIICNTENSTDKESAYINNLIQSDVKGVITIPAMIGNSDFAAFNRLQQNRIPLVFCNRFLNNVNAPFVGSNSFYGGLIATEHLISQGYKHIAYISLAIYSTSFDRYQGYLSALCRAGIPFQKEYVIFEKSFDENKVGYQATLALLKNHPEIDAIFAFNDAVAVNCYQAIVDSGLKPGKDIGLIGYDNTKICEIPSVHLSSIKFKNYEIGEKAAEILLNFSINEQQTYDHIVLMPELVVRESSKHI